MTTLKLIVAVCVGVNALLSLAAVVWCWRQPKAAPAWYLAAMQKGLAPVAWTAATDKQRVIVAIKYRLHR